jgi:hypothetical protein
MMSEKHDQTSIDNDNILGPGYEPLAVCLMILFIWMFVVAFASKFIM